MIKFGDRYDGRLLRKINHFQRFFPYIMPKRTESVVYSSHQINVENVMSYLKTKNKEMKNRKMTLFHVCVSAIVRVLAQKPRINRFIVGKRIFARNSYDISFIIKKELTEASKEITAKVSFDPYDTIEDISAKLSKHIEEYKNLENKSDDSLIKFVMKLPRFFINFILWILRNLDYYGLMPKSIIKMDPLYSSVFIANLGSIGLDAPFHHLYEWGTTSVFIVLGKIHKSPIIEEDGTISVKNVVNVTFTLDERISDGVYYSKSIELFKHYMENPQELEKPPQKVEMDEY